MKVCVRIEEKSWTREGSRPKLESGGKEEATRAAPAAGTPPATAAAPAQPQTPDASAPADGTASGAPKKKKLPPPPVTAARFGEADVPALAVELPEERSPASAPAPVLAPAPVSPETAPAREVDPFTIDPKLYLKRLIEYRVTHEPGFESVDEGCTQTVTVELYPLKAGWTVFARYSGNAREEKVDDVELDELDTFAERVTTALLRDRTIGETLTRTTVLRADSEAEVRRIQTRPHMLLAMGSDTRVGLLPTAPNSTDPAVDRVRAETPLSFSIGARNKFRSWALDATGRLNVNLVQLASPRNAGGGHADYSVGLGFGLGFLAYADPDAVNTLYYGGGGSFEVMRYQTLGARAQNGDLPTPGGLWGGGLNVDAILGYEFMRTSALHFFVQGTLSAPAYVFESENDQTRIHSYIPSLNVQVGILL